jgi:hypothetical protein
MSYYVYENWRAKGHAAKVHVGSCGFCKYGKGLSTGTRSDNGKWHGPVASLSAAKSAVPGVVATVCKCVH